MVCVIPPSIKRGDTIGIMAPASIVDKDGIDQSVEWLNARGFEVFVHPQTYEENGQWAGTVLQKVMAFQGLWQRDDIAAIWAGGGGNGTGFILDSINFDALKRVPKPLVGFSDVTSLLNAVAARTNIVTYHASVFQQLHKHKDADLALDVLQGNIQSVSLEGATTVVSGVAKGRLYGGNVSVFQSLIGTPYMPNLEDAIVFFEDCGDHISRVDRMLNHLKMSGALDGVKGMIFGQFTDMQDGNRPYGFTIDECISRMTQDLDVPILTHAPIGHDARNILLPVGQTVTLDAVAQTVSFS